MLPFRSKNNEDVSAPDEHHDANHYNILTFNYGGSSMFYLQLSTEKVPYFNFLDSFHQ